MNDLRVGMQIFHLGHPVELLYITDTQGTSQIWKVKPLFEEDPTNRSELFDEHDRISFIHTTPVR